MRSPLLGSGVATAALLAALLLVRTADAGGLSVSGAGCERVGGQVDKILCVVNTVRASAGLQPLRRVRALDVAERLKVREILNCDDFSHTPCGSSFEAPFLRTGYPKGRWRIGENLAWGTGERGSVVDVVRAWLDRRSTGTTSSRRPWRDFGASVAPADGTFGQGAVLWGMAFGKRS